VGGGAERPAVDLGQAEHRVVGRDDAVGVADQADAAAEAGESFESEEIVLTIEALDGRERKRWQFSYNSVMEAEHNTTTNSWLIEDHRLVCFEAIGADSEDE